ncbi:AAA family ATPase, partial [bacterium]|nr:AAA family ATPase [bacterium]
KSSTGRGATKKGGETASKHERRTIDSVHLKNFTAFKDLEMKFSPGINAIIGENATGKTSLLKVLYVACSCERVPGESAFPLDLPNYFFTTYHDKWNLIYRDADPRSAKFEIKASDGLLSASTQDLGRQDGGYSAGSVLHSDFPSGRIPSVFIPAKEMLVHNRWFISTYEEREIYFEKQYKDILIKAGLGPLKRLDSPLKQLIGKLEEAMGGRIEQDEEVYYLVTDGFWLEYTLVAEGLRKLGLLSLLIANGSIAPGTILFWDEPEANLNPRLLGKVLDVLLRLQRMDVQVFLATHNYVILKELDLLKTQDDEVLYHSLYRGEDGEITAESSGELTGLQNNPILDTFMELYDKEIERAAERLNE